MDICIFGYAAKYQNLVRPKKSQTEPYYNWLM